MDFKELQKGVVENAINYGKKYNVQIDEDFALIKLYEEVGELAQAVLIHRSNMSKDYHEYKMVKGPNYFKADIKKFFQEK